MWQTPRAFPGIMWRMRPRNAILKKAACVAALVFLALACASGRAEMGRVRWIQYPLFAQPGLVVSGGTLVAVTQVPVNDRVTGLRLLRDGAALRPEYEEVALPGSSTATVYLKVTVDTPPGLYDLELTYGDGGDPAVDVQPRAVGVLARAPKTFDFAIVSDIHYGDFRGSLHQTVDFGDIRGRVLDAADAAHPDFVLFCGDLTFAPFSFDKDYPKAYSEFFKRLHEPVFAVPGNHDLYRAGFGGREMGDGWAYWDRTFGQKYFAFDYGRWHFIGLNTYDWPAKYRSAADQKTMRESGSLQEGIIGDEQYQWLRMELTKARQRGQFVVVFGHHAPDAFSTGPMAKTPGFHSGAELMILLAKNGVRYYFCGHGHASRVDKRNGVSVIMTGTAGSDTSEGWVFRKVKATPDGKIKTEVVTVQK